MPKPSRKTGRFRAYIGLVSTGYLSRAAIENAVKEGLIFCALPNPTESALIFADVETAHSNAVRHSYTHPEIVLATARHFSSVTVVARAAYGLSTPRVLLRANGNHEQFLRRGYYELERQLPGKLSVKAWEDLPLAHYYLSKYPMEHLAPLEFAGPSPLVLCPKLKTDLFSDGLSGALALLSNHHNTTHMLEIADPALIVSDGIVVAAGPNRFTARGHELGAVIVANDAIAHDLVAAKILNLDPPRIAQLARAIEEGWGPRHFQEIELGGAGLEGIQSLSTKTRFWKLGLHSLSGFEERFQEEHPGFQLRVQKLLPETEGALGSPQERAVTSWLFKTYDDPKKALQLASWPSTKILCDATPVQSLLSTPIPKILLTIGRPATESFRKAIAHVFWKIPFWGGRLPYSIRIESVQLRNGARTILFSLPSDLPALAQSNALTWLFTLARGWRATWHLWRPSYILDRLAYRVSSFFKRRNSLHMPRVLTSRLPHNAWWTAPLRPHFTTSIFDSVQIGNSHHRKRLQNDPGPPII